MTATVSISVRAVRAGTITNTASVSSSTADPVASNNSATASSTLASAPALPVQATFVVGSGVSAEQQELVTRGLALGNGWFRSRLGRGLPPMTVYLFASFEELVATYAQVWQMSLQQARDSLQNVTATASQRRIFVHLENPSWSQRDDPTRLKIIIHEAFHIMQSELAGRNLSEGPAWLLEGAAEYVGYRVVAENGFLDLNTIRSASWIFYTKQVPEPLPALESASGFSAVRVPYQISPLAVELLIQSAGEPALIAFWERLGLGTAWRDAFQLSFGRTVEAFYNEFDTYRRGL